MNTVTKREFPCDNCDECAYIGEGDAVCMRNSEPQFVMDDWTFTVPQEPCDRLKRFLMVFTMERWNDER